MIIVVTGTPATGKTAIAKRIAKQLKLKYLDVKPIAKKISDKYDKKNKCYVVSIKKLNEALIKQIKKNKNLVIDSHLSHYLPSKYVDLCIVTKTELKELRKRLNKRSYTEQKIRDNLEAEAFDACLEEARQKKHKIIVIDTTKNVEKQLKQIWKN